MTIEQLYQVFLKHPSIQTDTRKLTSGDLYFALKGERFDGNAFADAALQAGAAYAIVDNPQIAVNDSYIVVDDVLSTLQALAQHHREQFNIPFIGITGSNGKTTTKELVHAVLSSQYRTYTTVGNLNNHIGIPLTLLRVQKDAQFAIVEMGANHQKEIAGYCTYTAPTHGIITNCGKAHLEGFGGVEGVRKGKGELYDYLRNTNGTAFVMWDYDYLQTMSQNIQHIIRYGTSHAEINGQVLDSAPYLRLEIEIQGDRHVIQTQLVGDYNLPNVLVAVAVGHHFNVPMHQIIAAIEHYHPENSRSQMIEWKGNRVILDAYNANPTSMKAAIENFSRVPAHKKILMLGAMAELGDESIMEHEQIVQLITQLGFDHVVLVGGDFAKIKHPFIQLPDSTAGAEWLQAQSFTDAHVLIKGSRSMKMENVIA
jgi:UDP-N-acetylmuramoyl-tripeptide--D-alanyl-D-alanine ligase